MGINVIYTCMYVCIPMVLFLSPGVLRGSRILGDRWEKSERWGAPTPEEPRTRALLTGVRLALFAPVLSRLTALQLRILKGRRFWRTMALQSMKLRSVLGLGFCFLSLYFVLGSLLDNVLVFSCQTLLVLVLVLSFICCFWMCALTVNHLDVAET